MNFAGRQAHVINNAPMVELSGFSIGNTFFNSSTRLKTDLRWKNIGQVPIIAFEVVLAYFDPFNRRISGPGGVWLVTGRSSGDWNPLAPGASSGDGLIALREQAVMTAFVYVRAVRLQDGTVWYFDPAPVEAEIRRLLPEIREIGNLDPDASTGGR